MQLVYTSRRWLGDICSLYIHVQGGQVTYVACIYMYKVVSNGLMSMDKWVNVHGMFRQRYKHMKRNIYKFN